MNILISDIIRKDEKITALIAVIHGDCHTSKEVQILMNHSDLWLKVHSLDFTKTAVIKSHPKGKVEKTLYDIQIENGKLSSAKVSSNPIEVKSVQVPQGMSLSNYNFDSVVRNMAHNQIQPNWLNLQCCLASVSKGNVHCKCLLQSDA